MKKILKYGQYLLVLFCIAIFFYMLKDFNSADLKSLVKKINYLWIAVTILTAIFISLIKVFRLKVIAEQFNYKVDFKTAYKSQIISILLAFLTPGRVGEVSKVYLLANGQKEKYQLITSIMLFEMISDFICIATISLLFFIFIMKNILLSVFTAILLILAISGIIFITKGNKLVEKFPESIQKFFRYISSHHVNIFYKWYLTIPFTISAWVMDGFYQYFILRSVDNISNPFTLVGISAISSIISVVSILPLGFGVNDLSSLFLYKSFLNLKTEYVLFLVNATRLFWVITLFTMAIPFIGIIFKGQWKEKTLPPATIETKDKE